MAVSSKIWRYLRKNVVLQFPVLLQSSAYASVCRRSSRSGTGSCSSSDHDTDPEGCSEARLSTLNVWESVWSQR